MVSGRKAVPLEQPLKDLATFVDRTPPGTLVVPELISVMVEGGTYENPSLSKAMIVRLQKIYDRFASHVTDDGDCVMSVEDVEKWLVEINGEVGRGSEFRKAARLMGWKDDNPEEETSFVEQKARIVLPKGGFLSRDGFLEVYEDEVKQGKFWGIAHDVAVLGQPLPDAGVFQSRFDRIYCSAVVQPLAVMDFECSEACPNESEPSDHLPVAGLFAFAPSS